MQQRLAVDPGIPRVSPNDLRSTFGSWLKQRGVDSMIVARLMGHTTSRMVELVYGKPNDVTLANALALLPFVPGTQAESPPPAATVVVTTTGYIVTIGGAASTFSGSNRVADESEMVRQMRQARTSETEESRQPAVPRVGIEPTTRGFFQSPLCALSLGFDLIYEDFGHVGVV